GAEPLSTRPLAHSGTRRPTCSLALHSAEPRRRSHHLLDLRPVALPSTARRHVPPPPPVRPKVTQLILITHQQPIIVHCWTNGLSQLEDLPIITTLGRRISDRRWY
ncbi:jg23836, partial [Pararge aegeria aegeria]